MVLTGSNILCGCYGGTRAAPDVRRLMRAALSRLLADIEAGRVDIIVVYKVDRLTRALSDFARLVEIFDRHAVSFVSVTRLPLAWAAQRARLGFASPTGHDSEPRRHPGEASQPGVGGGDARA